MEKDCRRGRVMQADQLGSHGDARGLNPGAGEKTLVSASVLNVEAPD